MLFVFFNDTATTEIYTLSLHDALPIWAWNPSGEPVMQREGPADDPEAGMTPDELREFRSKAHAAPGGVRAVWADRKSTRLNSSHANISYAVFCLKKKKISDLQSCD